VAIKVLRPELAANDASLERFVREARAAARIANDHVVRVFDVGGIEDREPFIVMEYLEGEDLARRLERGILSVPEAVGILLQACTAIAEVHRAGVIHRDLKPANLFLARSRGGASIVKVVDFGISKLSPRNGRDEVALTSKGIAVGTPLYMAPEQLRGAVEIDPRADVWALGVILFEMLTGRAPFEETDFLILCTRIATAPTPRLAAVRPDLAFPSGLDDVLEHCLAKHPDDRCFDAGELARELTPFLRHVTLRMVERPVTPPAAAPATPVSPRGEIASTLISRRATWEMPSERPDQLSPRSTLVTPARHSPSRVAVAVLAVAVPVVAFAALVASCVSSLHAHDARSVAAGTAPTTLPAATVTTAVVVRESAPIEPPSLAASASAIRPTPSAPPPLPAAPPPARSEAPNRPPPGDEFGGRL
jgi:serine/threonine protein kinase